jgi:hypothetical protein
MATIGDRATNAFRLPVQDLVRHDTDECAAHEGTALGRADELFPRDREHEFQQAAIQIGIAFLEGRFEWQSGARQLPAQGVKCATFSWKLGRGPNSFVLEG